VKVISNASPIINLAWIGKLELLSKLFGQLIIPKSVWVEIVVKGKEQTGSNELKSAGWIQTQEATNHELVQSLRQDLDAGEAEAIALALETKADLLLMDERLGRETANYFDINVVGVIVILIEAKRKGLLKEVKPSLDLLHSLAGFYIRPSLYERILREQGELD
jgi:predicted nucleic acid-binding protein